jgi:hypothetical protein
LPKRSLVASGAVGNRRSTGAATLLLIGAVAAAILAGQHSSRSAAATPPAASVVPGDCRAQQAADERSNIDVFKSRRRP